MNNNLISIILPCYNSELFIARTITSILEQTYRNFELIIINDGSTDCTQKICESFCDERIKIINKMNSGVANSRNIGIQNANGKYIMFIDSDDIFEKNMIEIMYKCAIENNVDIVRAGYQYWYDENNKVPVKENVEPGLYNSEQIKDILIPKLLKEEMKGYLWLLLIRKDLVVPFSEELFIYEDLTFYLEVFIGAKKIYILKEKLYNYNKNNENSLTKKNIEKNILNMILASEYICAVLKKYEIYNKINISQIYTRIYTNILNYIYVVQYNKGCSYAYNKYKEYKVTVNQFNEIISFYDEKWCSKKEKIFNATFQKNRYIIFCIICFVKNFINRRNKK